MWRKNNLASVLVGGRLRWLWQKLGSHIISMKLCALMGILHAETDRPLLKHVVTSWEKLVDNVGEIVKHRIRSSFFQRDIGNHANFLSTRYRVIIARGRRLKIRRQLETLEARVNEYLLERERIADKIKITPKSEKRLAIAIAVLDIIVISVSFIALSSDLPTLLAMGILPGLLVVASGHGSGILLRSISKASSEQEPTTTQSPGLFAKGRIRIALITSLFVGNAMFIIIVGWFRAYASVNTSDLINRDTWIGPLPSVTAFTLLFAIISLLAFIVTMNFSWLAYQEDVIRVYTQLRLSLKRLKVLKKELKLVDNQCQAAEDAHNLAFTTRTGSLPILQATLDENKADTKARVNSYRNANFTMRTDGEDPFHDIPVHHEPVSEEETDQLNWSHPMDTTLTEEDLGLDEELDLLTR